MDGSRIVSEQWDNKLMIFSYDESGAPKAIHYRLNGSAEDVFYTYYLEKNLQGDIIEDKYGRIIYGVVIFLKLWKLS